MKKTLSIVVLFLVVLHFSYAQTYSCGGDLPSLTGENAWAGEDINRALGDAELVFEGKVLSDSVVFFNPPGVCSIHRVLVLKQFKGNFKSDTVEVYHLDVLISNDGRSYVNKGDIGIFMGTTALNHTSHRVDVPDLYWLINIKTCGFVNVCNKKEDEVQEMYAKLERHIGHKHTEVHPRVCAGPEDQKKSPVLKTRHLRNDGRLASTIFYSLENATISGPSVNFSIYSYVIDSLITLYGGGAIVYRYDSLQMGSHLVSSGRLTATMASSLSTAYSLSMSDLSANEAIMQISPTANLDTATALPLTTAATPLLSCQLTPAQPVTSISDTTISMDSAAMQDQSTYLTPADTLSQFQTVDVSENIKSSLRSNDSIYLSIANTVLSGSPLPTYLDFDIVGNATNGQPLYSYNIVTSYNTSAFDSAYITNSLGLGDDGSNPGGVGYPIYSFSSSFTGGSITIGMSVTGGFDGTDADGYEIFDAIGLGTPIAHVTLHISDCGYVPGIAIDPSSTVSYADVSQVQAGVSYTEDTASASYNNGGQPMCILPPSITTWSPSCINAGSFEVLTITGTGFGSSPGTVWFTDADQVIGPYTASTPKDIISWSSTQIQLLIPCVDGIPGGYIGGTPATGTFYVQTAAGATTQGQSGNYISIGYANENRRNPDSTLSFVYLKRPFVFQLASNLYYTPGAMHTIQDMLANMNCALGVNFQLDTTGPSTDSTSIAGDGINLISIQPLSHFSSGSVWAQTLLDTRYVYCGTGLAQYNNESAYQKEVDIEVNESPSGGTWLWSDSILPASNQNDFASVILHELGHAAMLRHTLPVTRFNGNVMAPTIGPGQYLRNYASDDNDIAGENNVLTLGDTMGIACNDTAGLTPVYPSGCSARSVSNCTGGYTDGINTVSSSGAFSVSLYPNPYQDNTIVHIDVSGFSNLTISVYDLLGQIVLQKNVQTDSSIDVPLSNFNSGQGLYMVEISDGHNKATLKLIKM